MMKSKQITLKEEVEILDIRKKTTAKMFCELEIGEKLLLEFDLDQSRYYKGTIRITRLKTGEVIRKTDRELDNLLGNFLVI